MQRLMRKYRNYILVFILLFIGLPMLFFGIPEFMNSATVDPQGEIIGHVGDEVIYESAFRQRLDDASRRYGTQNNPMSYPDLAKAGHADKVVEDMIDASLISIKEKERDFAITDATAAELLKFQSDFQDADGNFDQKAFEEWRDKQNERGMNWNELYKGLQSDLSRQVYMNLALAAAYRVTDEDLEKELNKKYEKLRIRYTKVTPPIYLSEAEIQSHYDSHLEDYKDLEQRVAEFIAVPIASARPTKADEAFKALAEGQDFAAVADTFSDQQTKNGGDIDWQTPLDNEEPYRQKLFDLAVGEVSDLVTAPQGYFIYKVEEERTNADTGKREVKARQIFLLNPTQSEEERNAQSANMAGIVAEANTNGLDAAATKFAFPTAVTGSFDKESVEIENIPRMDAIAFRDKLKDSSADMQYISVTGRENNYCAKVTQVLEGTVKPLAEVREQVIEDAKKAKSMDQEFLKLTKAHAYKIGREIKTLDDIRTIYPDIEMEIKDSSAFGAQDNLFQQGIMVMGDEIFKALDGKESGEAVGPIKDFSSGYYFVEVLERIPPTDTDKEKFEEERKTMRDNLYMRNQEKYLADYRKKMRNSMLADYEPDIDPVRLATVLGVNEATESAPATDGTTPATTTDGAAVTPTDPAATPAPAADAATPAPAAEPPVVN